MFLSPWFAVAGLALAATPLLIHLLNRQRYRVVEWAAMDFLRHAVRRSRRFMRIQDLLLLLLRTACVLLFGLAMARPFFAAPGEEISPDQPVHAVLVLDNSLSMGYQQLDRTLLDESKARAKEFVDKLPPASRISILPACGSAQEFSLGAYSTKEDAVEALEAIEPVDRSATAAAAIDLAKDSCRRVPSPPTKQIVFLSDQQAVNWPAYSLESQMSAISTPVQVVQAGASETENAWISDFRLQEEIADLGTPSVFLATIRYEGAAPRSGVQVTLSIDGNAFASQTVDLQPGQAREVRFPPYQFDMPVQPGQVVYVPAEVSMGADHLPADDRRCLAVPVVSALPVVFVDSIGADEDPHRNRYGETYRLRRLLAPVTSRNERDRQLVQVRHVKFNRLDEDILKDARLVVIAGVVGPEPESVPMLRQYVEQGGSLVVAAGGDFDPVQWNTAAWNNGLGILPAPLKPEPVGALPGPSATGLKPFQFDVSSLVHEYFTIEQTPREQLEELYRLPFFFKAIDADVSDEAVQAMVQNVASRIDKDRVALAETTERLRQLNDLEAKGVAGIPERQERAGLEQKLRELQPDWLLWSGSQAALDDAALSPLDLAERSRPQVLGRYTNQTPFMVQREIGRGRVLFVSTGMFRHWNTLSSTNTVLIFDRIFRDLLGRTLPKRNLTSTERLVVPVPPELRTARITVTSPDGKEAPISVDALGTDRYGLVVSNLPKRGFYRIRAQASGAVGATAEHQWMEVLLAVNGPEQESELRPLSDDELRDRMAGSEYRWVSREETIRLASAMAGDQELWRYFLMAVLACLAVEMAVLAWPLAAREQSA